MWLQEPLRFSDGLTATDRRRSPREMTMKTALPDHYAETIATRLEQGKARLRRDFLTANGKGQVVCP